MNNSEFNLSQHQTQTIAFGTYAADQQNLFAVRAGINAEDALAHASLLLGCAAANAYETADQVRGDEKHLARSVVCLIEMAKAAVDAVLVREEGRCT